MTTEQRKRLRYLSELLKQSADTERPVQFRARHSNGLTDWKEAALVYFYGIDYRIAPMDPFDEWWLSYKPHRVCRDDTARQDCSNAWHAALQYAKTRRNEATG